MPSLPVLARMATALDTHLSTVIQASGYDDHALAEVVGPRMEQSTGIALLHTLQQLLAIEAASVTEALAQTSTLLAAVMSADKIDAFLRDPATETLVAVGWSNTPMGHQQRQIGMNRLPIANRGREVEVFETGLPYLSGNARADTKMLIGTTQGLGVQSMLAVPLDVGGTRRGVLVAEDSRRDHFSAIDVPFFEAVASWVGVVVHRAELTELLAAGTSDSARQSVEEENLLLLTHELTNHLTPLFGRVDMLYRRAQREGRQDYLRDARSARQALSRMRHLIADPLDTARLEQGTVVLSRAWVDLVEIVRRVAAEIETEEQTIKLQLPDTLMVEVDESKILQVLENVVRNAVRHSQPTMVLTLALVTGRRDGAEWVEIAIQDNGPGIPADVVPTIFQRFARGPGSTGLGLGLYLARAIAVAHGGTLTVDSTVGTGTIFTLSLPVGVAPSEAIAPPVPVSAI
jgi:two-component system OmpR family sensor kinase